MITIRPINNDYNLGFIMEGHADYAPHGQDIVCASVSSALFTTYNALKQQVMNTKIESTMENGYAQVKVHIGNMYSDAVINAFIVTLQEIQKIYPNTVEIGGFL